METEKAVLEKEVECTVVIYPFCITQKGITLAICSFFFAHSNDC